MALDSRNWWPFSKPAEYEYMYTTDTRWPGEGESLAYGLGKGRKAPPDMMGQKGHHQDPMSVKGLSVNLKSC